ncbi:MAG: tyrosine--tRNA ligase, partial [Myxococcota bacterium]|nr:tyrosine--tRNA ligase [Myxococcota bacterium]
MSSDEKTTEFKSSVLAELSWRGLIKQVTHDELDEKLSGEDLTLYCGFDPSADSLHAGNLVSIMGLAHFRRHGHHPIALVGGATGMIGDPSGKSSERDLLDDTILQKNLAGISAQLRTILDRSTAMHAEGLEASDRDIPIVNNADWIRPWSFIDFLRDVGKHFKVNHMINKTSVKERLENRDQGISY